MIKIIKNVTSTDIFIADVGVNFIANSSYTVHSTQYSALASSIEIIPYITDDSFVINNGEEDLPAVVGVIHVNGGVRKVIQEVAMLPGIGDSSPAIVELSPALIALACNIGDHFYAHFKLTNLIGDHIIFRWHGTATNSVTDVWAQIELYCLTSTGYLDKDLTTYDTIVTIGPFELLPPTPNIISYIESTLTTTLFANGEDLVFIGVKRVAATGKTDWTGPLYVVKHCVEYWQKVIP